MNCLKEEIQVLLDAIQGDDDDSVTTEYATGYTDALEAILQLMEAKQPKPPTEEDKQKAYYLGRLGGNPF